MTCVFEKLFCSLPPPPLDNIQRHFALKLEMKTNTLLLLVVPAVAGIPAVDGVSTVEDILSATGVSTGSGVL
jgi:hypothetical protein